MATASNPYATSAFVCYNPHCMSRHKSFVNEKAFTMHFERSPSCLAFVRQSSATQTRPISLKGIDATLDKTLITSTKRPKPLRCDVVNDITNCASAAAFSALPNVLDFNMDDMDDDNAMFDDAQGNQVLDDNPNNDDIV